MMSEKYDSDIEAGLLYYMRTGHLQSVEAPRKEKRSLILSRNQIARFLSFGNQRSHTPVPGCWSTFDCIFQLISTILYIPRLCSLFQMIFSLCFLCNAIKHFV